MSWSDPNGGMTGGVGVADQTRREVELWLDMVRWADKVHSMIPSTCRRQENGEADHAELAMVALSVAGLSPAMRAHLVATLENVLSLLDESSAPQRPPLRLAL